MTNAEQHENETPEDEAVQEDTPETPSPEENPLEAELAKVKDQLLRAVADSDNLRKRAERERSDISKYAVTGFARDLLNVSDNLRRALESVPEDTRKDNPIVEGVEATERELQRIFEAAGITKMEPQGQKFDPNLHEVMFEVETSEQEPGTIMQVLETGYMIHDRLLRPARVGVAKNSGAPPPEQIVDEEV